MLDRNWRDSTPVQARSPLHRRISVCTLPLLHQCFSDLEYRSRRIALPFLSFPFSLIQPYTPRPMAKKAVRTSERRRRSPPLSWTSSPSFGGGCGTAGCFCRSGGWRTSGWRSRGSFCRPCGRTPGYCPAKTGRSPHFTSSSTLSKLSPCSCRPPCLRWARTRSPIGSSASVQRFLRIFAFILLLSTPTELPIWSQAVDQKPPIFLQVVSPIFSRTLRPFWVCFQITPLWRFWNLKFFGNSLYERGLEFHPNISFLK